MYKPFPIAAAAAALAVGYTTPASAWTSFLAEQTDYAQCGGTNLNTITATLKNTLDSDGYNATRYVNANSWPQDWIEQCTPSGPPYGNGDGADRWYADAHSFSVYAGHGSEGRLAFGVPHNGLCEARLGAMMRLGQMSQGPERAGTTWYLSSCTMNTSKIVSDVNYQWVHQQAGFHNSAQINSTMVDWTYFLTGLTALYSNTSAWHAMMSSYGNSSIVVSYGHSAAFALTVEQDAAVRADNFVFNGRSSGPSCGNQPPLFYYRVSMINNGGC